MGAGVFIAGLLMLIAATVGHRIIIRQLVIPRFPWTVRAAFGALGLGIMALAVLQPFTRTDPLRPPGAEEIADSRPPATGPAVPVAPQPAEAPTATRGTVRAGAGPAAAPPNTGAVPRQPPKPKESSAEGATTADLRGAEIDNSLVAAASRCVGTVKGGDNMSGGQVGLCITNNNGPDQAAETEE